MIDSEKLLKIGEFVKAHGIKGELVLKLSIEISESEIKEQGPVFVLIDKLPVPFFIEKIKKYGSRKLLIKFKDYDNIAEIEELLGLYAFIQTENTLSEQELNIEGFVVFDKGKKLGNIINVEDFNGNIVLTIDCCGEKLIPFNEDFILDINTETKEIILDLPEGLL